MGAATAVPAGYYRHFAEWLAGRGCAVLTFDYRGIAASRDALRHGEDVRLRDWARLDMAAALHAADRNGRSIGVRGVHAQLEQLDIPLSFLSVREVLKRLCSEGVIQLGSDKCYSLAPQARAILEQAPAR